MTRLNRPILVAALTLLGAVAWAQKPASQEVKVDITAQSLRTALTQFAQQTGVQLLFTEEEVPLDIKAPRLVGTYTLQNALKELLVQSKLRAEFINARTVAIRNGAASKTGARSATDAASVRLAQAEGMTRVERDPPAAGNDEETMEADAGIPELLVKGHRSLNTDIKRTEDAPQPYVVFGQEEIQRSQAINLEDFLKNRLPMNTTSTTNAQEPASANTASTINLRGLGANQTLILVDGRRMPGLTEGGRPQQSDINGIPMSAVERIEVLPSTAGGIYGGSATGGVINIILRRDYNGLETRASYANTFDTDAGATVLEGNAGFSLEGGRTRVMASATYSTANQLVFGDREFSQRARALQRANNPALMLNTTIPPVGRTVNIISASVDPATRIRQPLQLDFEYGGDSLGFTTTHIPLGYRGPESDNGLALLRNAGTYNLDLPLGALGTERGLIATPTRRSATLNVRREFSERVEAFLDLATFGNRGRSVGNGVSNFAFGLPEDAPNNPFRQPINVSFPTPGLAFESLFRSTTVRATGGVIARLPFQWTGEIDYGWSRSRAEGSSTIVAFEGIVSDELLSSGEPASDGRPALNVLQEQNTFPLDFSPYLLPAPSLFDGPSDTVLKDATLRLSGPLFKLPGGALTLSALLERREETLDDFNEQYDEYDLEWYYTYYPQRSQKVDSVYLEARAPLVSPALRLSWAHALEVQASIRRDEYRTRSDGSSGYDVPSRDGPFPIPEYATSELASTDYTLGLRYAPIEDLTLRASIGTGFLPATVSQITPNEASFNFAYGFTDPFRGGNDIFTGTPIPYLVAGNPDLRPETSESWSAGMILTPRFAPELRLSVDYTRIDKKDEIQTPNAQFVINNPQFFPGRVERGSNLGTDQPGWLGRITSLDLTLVNIARTSVAAYDIQLDYRMSTERFSDFHWYAMATWQKRYSTQALPTEAMVDYVGFGSGPLQWRGNFGVNWERDALTVGWNAQYFDSYVIYGPTDSPANRDRVVTSQGSGGVIPRQLYHDLIATYRFGAGNTEVSLGVQNVFNKMPPILASAFAYNNAYSNYGDPRLRRYSISVRKAFK